MSNDLHQESALVETWMQHLHYVGHIGNEAQYGALSIRKLLTKIAHQQTAQGWQPIETAPREGGWIIVPGPRLVRYVVSFPEGYWISSHHELVEPTIWFQIPDPPASPDPPQEPV